MELLYVANYVLGTPHLSHWSVREQNIHPYAGNSLAAWYESLSCSNYPKLMTKGDYWNINWYFTTSLFTPAEKDPGLGEELPDKPLMVAGCRRMEPPLCLTTRPDHRGATQACRPIVCKLILWMWSITSLVGKDWELKQKVEQFQLDIVGLTLRGHRVGWRSPPHG